ncbi:MAG: CoA transferase [Betaproteobacteria bacterium]|nr:CoA transferase [Betaproteobacteria bacterium]
MSGNNLFEGIKVLAVARQIAAPFATYQLALHGAEVLTIDNPREIDSMRLVVGAGGGLHKHAMSHSFLAQAANKKSMQLDIASPKGQDIFRKLAAQSDVIVENLVAGNMAKYGLGYDDLKKINPKIIYCSVTGYGQSGPAYKRAAIDGAVQAASGLMSMTGTAQTGPMKVGFLMADYATGYAAALGIVGALYHRAKTGEGQHVDCAMLDTAMTMAGADLCEAATTGKYQQLRGNGDGRYISNIFRCRQGMLSVAATTESRRARFWKAINRPDIPLDARFANAQTVAQHYPAFCAEIEKTLVHKTALEWEEIVSDAGVAAMAVRDLNQAMDNPQIKHRGLMHTFAFDAELGYAVSVPKAPYQLSKTGARIHSPPPRVGQHTDEILQRLGFDENEIAKLHQSGVVEGVSVAQSLAKQGRG